MVFSSLEFLYLFLPVVFGGFLALRSFGSERGIIWWLVAASLVFYAAWNPAHLPLLLGSILGNYALHKWLLSRPDRSVLWLGIVGNLAVLGYFKYASFVVGNAKGVLGADIPALDIVLPLAISFFTFQQISFLYDTYKGRVVSCDFSRYLLFVTFFPQLIAGPIIMQKDTIPQFTGRVFTSRLATNIAVGGTMFAIGLFKKIVLADGVAPYADTVFDLARDGVAVPMEAAWIGALAYSFQIYFDFSGYCDMALGLARLFGIRLPINFHSPYKSRSITEFWRRWHITLSRFLRDYVYIPLGGNRHGRPRRYANLLATMLLGGLWHGAAWTFVFWGALHGAYLIVNHGWNALRPYLPWLDLVPAPLRLAGAQGLTLLAVIVAWVFFRAESFTAAGHILQGMAGLGAGPATKPWAGLMADSGSFWLMAILLGTLVLFAPNAVELTRRYRPVIDHADAGRMHDRLFRKLAWRPTLGWSAAIAVLGLAATVQLYRLGDLTAFIYFNF